MLVMSEGLIDNEYLPTGLKEERGLMKIVSPL